MTTNPLKPRSPWFIFLILGVLATLGITMGIFFSLHPTWVGEQAGNANYVHRTLGLLSDLPHMTVEMFYDAVENSGVFVVIWFFTRRRWRAEHAKFDAEHGIHHEELDET
jgi:hypothetical protein